MKQDEVGEFLGFMCDEYGLDFRDYANSSLLRRLRFAAERFSVSSLAELRAKILQSPERAYELLSYLTINTTEFFRDPAHFLIFRKEIVPILKTYHRPRLWIAGCSTGQELLSYSIILQEEGLLDRAIIYATDLNMQNLKLANQRIFRLDEMRKASEGYVAAGGTVSLSEYYNSDGRNVIFSGDLTKNVIFANHCLATDSGFSEFSFISCRYVMIYFNTKLQQRVLQLFWDSLDNFGVLGLGRVEDIRFIDNQLLFNKMKISGFYRKNPELWRSRGSQGLGR